MKRKFFGYVLVCDGCCTDIKLEAWGSGTCGVVETKTSFPIFKSSREALKEGKLAVTAYPDYTYRVFTYEMK